MARTRTLADLRADVRFIADIEGQTDRHPDANLTRLINQAWAAFRDLVCENGYPYYLSSASGNFTAGTATYAVAAGCYRIYGVDVTVDDDVRTLQQHSMMERNQWATTAKGVPVSFWLRATALPPVMAMQPVPDQAYAYTYYYLPQQTDLAADADIVDGFNGWEDWIVYKAALGCLTRDDDAEQYALVKDLLMDRERDIRRNAPKRVRITPGHRVDTRGERRFNERRARRYHS